MQNEKLHITQAHPDITQVVLRIGTRKAESGANFTYVRNCPYDRSQFKKLLEFSCINVPFRFHNDNYIQIDDVAMGSPIAPMLADIFISKLEEKLYRFTINKPRIWYRYVDDILCIFNNRQNLTDFLSRINKWHPNIHFTIEREKTNVYLFSIC